jgi:hypothetical protein
VWRAGYDATTGQLTEPAKWSNAEAVARQTQGTQAEQDTARDEVQRRIDALKGTLANTLHKKHPSRKNWQEQLTTLQGAVLPRGHQKVTARSTENDAAADEALPTILDAYRKLPIETVREELEQLEANGDEWPAHFPMDAVADYEDAGGEATREGWQTLTARAVATLHRHVLEREGQQGLPIDAIATKHGGVPVEAPTSNKPLPASDEGVTVEPDGGHTHGRPTPAAGEQGEPARGDRTEGSEHVAQEPPEPEAGVSEPEKPPADRKRRPPRRVAGVRNRPPPAGGEAPGPRGEGPGAVSHVDTADVADAEDVGDAHARGEAPRFYTIGGAEDLTAGGWVSKLEDNLAALRLLKILERDKRPASDAEQAVLARYVGWGQTNLSHVVDLRGVDHISDPREKQGRQELERLLTKDELKELGESSPNAHYSFAELPRALWAIAQHVGFKGGTILEPAIGTGHFIGTMPGEIRAHRRTRVHGVDKEPIASAIARQLYQGAYIQTGPLQEANLPDNYFDLVISNVPFGKIEVFDPAFIASDRAFLTKSIHNYYFGKALDVARPGGLILFVTSRFTLDAESDSVRRYIAARARLLGAFRLPDTAFKKTAGTEVVTDVLVLQKHGPGVSGAGPAWTDSVLREDIGSIYDHERGMFVKPHTTEYYVAHPEMVLGKEANSGKMHGRGSSTTSRARSPPNNCAPSSSASPATSTRPRRRRRASSRPPRRPTPSRAPSCSRRARRSPTTRARSCRRGTRARRSPA